jgi:VWFA-related protein
VDLVTVPVVVRDAKGRAVGGLTQENFELFDKGKRQQITSFAVQAEAGESAGSGDARERTWGSGDRRSRGKRARGHWVVYLFDDMHLKFEDLTRVRDAAERHIAKLEATDRAGIVSTSGLVVVQFTADKTRLLEALLKIHANPAGAGSSTQGCPEISYYEADQILRGSPTDMSSNLAWQVATQDMVACSGMPSDFAARAALAKARMVDEVSGQEVRSVISVMKDVIKGLANAPGTRTIVLISPGFMLPVGTGLDEGDVVEEAIRAQVVISSLDARGLYVESWVSDIDRGGGGPQNLVRPSRRLRTRRQW